MKCFWSNYHISVNPTLSKDLHAIGIEQIMPTIEFAKNHIEFFAPNDEHTSRATMVSYKQFLELEPMVLLITCMQHVDDFMKLYRERGEKDVIMYLTANSDAANWYDPAGTDYLMSHDLDFHRIFKGKYKILYFNQPTFDVDKKDEAQLRKTFNEKKVKLYINNFDKEGFEPEYKSAQLFRDMYERATGYRIPFFGYGMPDGWPQPPETHREMRDSMFTLTFKRRETWGQMVNESMQLGTPVIFHRKYIYSTFKEYLVNYDTSLIVEDQLLEADEMEAVIKQITSMTYEQYETLVNEAYSQSRMFCNDEVRREKLAWLFDKVAKDAKMLQNVVN